MPVCGVAADDRVAFEKAVDEVHPGCISRDRAAVVRKRRRVTADGVRPERTRVEHHVRRVD